MKNLQSVYFYQYLALFLQPCPRKLFQYIHINILQAICVLFLTKNNIGFVSVLGNTAVVL